MSRSTRRKARKTNGRRSGQPNPPPAPGLSTADAGGETGTDTITMVRHRAILRLMDIAFMPLDGEDVSSAQIRIIEASRKACIDLLREITREERRLKEPDCDRESGSREPRDREPPAPESTGRDRLRPGDAEVLVNALEEEGLEDLAAIASLIGQEPNTQLPSRNGRADAIRAGPPCV